MPVIAHSAPWDAAFRRIEIAIRQRHEQGCHAIFRVSAEISEKHTVPFAVYGPCNTVRAAVLRIGAENLIYITALRRRKVILPEMLGERIKPTPVCPSCGKPMRFVRAIPQADGLPALRTYDCKGCGVAMTAAQHSQPASTATTDRATNIPALFNHGLLVSVPEEAGCSDEDEAPSLLRLFGS
jgi:hypothetical protein